MPPGLQHAPVGCGHGLGVHDRVVPQVIEDRCAPCNACREICPEGAISVDSIARIDAGMCTGCGACVYVCPPTYAALRLPPSPTVIDEATVSVTSRLSPGERG